VLVIYKLMDMEHWCNINGRRKRNYCKKTSPSVSFSTKNAAKA